MGFVLELTAEDQAKLDVNQLVLDGLVAPVNDLGDRVDLMDVADEDLRYAWTLRAAAVSEAFLRALLTHLLTPEPAESPGDSDVPHG